MPLLLQVECPKIAAEEDDLERICNDLRVVAIARFAARDRIGKFRPSIESCSVAMANCRCPFRCERGGAAKSF